jgi:hypothetical protein
MTVFNDIISAMVQATQSDPPISSQIHRARIRPLPENWSDAVVIRISDAQLDRAAIRNAPVDVDTTVVVECYARSASMSPDVVADALMQVTYARLAEDPTLGGLVADCVLTSINWNFDTDADKTACVSMTYVVRHRTHSLTLEQ